MELLGYAATDEELFIIYEYATKGSLKSHLHDSHNKGEDLLFHLKILLAKITCRVHAVIILYVSGMASNWCHSSYGFPM